MNLRTVTATRYVTPLREGGSMPALIEADDGAQYVLKFRGAGQGKRALIAELLVGEIARVLNLRVPEIVFVKMSAELARSEPDSEIRELVKASEGLNLALQFLPKSLTFDPLSPRTVTERKIYASSVVWLDALCSNVDRTPRNPNLLLHERELWLIDHGAALYFHHGWNGEYSALAKKPFPFISEHVLLPFADALEEADFVHAEQLTPDVLQNIVNLIPDEWLGDLPELPDVEAHRAAYLNYFFQRLEAPRGFVQEAMNARS